MCNLSVYRVNLDKITGILPHHCHSNRKKSDSMVPIIYSPNDNKQYRKLSSTHFYECVCVYEMNIVAQNMFGVQRSFALLNFYTMKTNANILHCFIHKKTCSTIFDLIDQLQTKTNYRMHRFVGWPIQRLHLGV